jgi:hypothetical protein
MTITVIHGAMATGKTMHRERFRQQYGCTRIVEDWPYWKGDGEPASGDLVLTNHSPDQIAKKLPDARLVHIDTARAAIGLEPAPRGGFMQAAKG